MTVETVAEIVLPSSLDAKYAAKDQEEMPNRRVEHIEGFFDCAPREVHPWQRSAMPSQGKLQESANYPVLVTPNPMAQAQVCVSRPGNILKLVFLRGKQSSSVSAAMQNNFANVFIQLHEFADLYLAGSLTHHSHFLHCGVVGVYDIGDQWSSRPSSGGAHQQRSHDHQHLLV